MRVIGHGVDLVEVARIAGMVRAHRERFLDRVFTPREQAYAAARPKREGEHLAVRFAAKEAALKALGTGWSRGIAWTEIEVIHASGGQPELIVTGQAASIADSAGITGWVISLSHTETQAMASVIATG